MMKRINVYLTENQIQALRELSDKTGLSVAEHIRRALDAYIQKVKNERDDNESV